MECTDMMNLTQARAVLPISADRWDDVKAGIDTVYLRDRLSDARELYSPVVRVQVGGQRILPTRAKVQDELEKREARLHDFNPWKRSSRHEPQYAPDLLFVEDDESDELDGTLELMEAHPVYDGLGPVPERVYQPPKANIKDLRDPGFQPGHGGCR